MFDTQKLATWAWERYVLAGDYEVLEALLVEERCFIPKEDWESKQYQKIWDSMTKTGLVSGTHESRPVRLAQSEETWSPFAALEVLDEY